jgi:hypothetical protein
MLVISDVHEFLSVTCRKPTHTQLKLQFYAGHILSENFSVDAVRYVIGEVEVERRRHDNDDSEHVGRLN